MQLFAGGAGGGGATGQPFMFLPFLTNPKYVSGFQNVTSTGNVSLYTVPSNRRAIYFGYSGYNYNAGSSSNYAIFNSSSTWFQASTVTSTSTVTTIQKQLIVPYVGEAGEQFGINVSAQPFNVWPFIIEFDNTNGLKSSKLLTVANGDNTIYTVTSGKTGMLLTSQNPQSSAAILAYFNGSGSSRTTKLNIVPNGGSAGATNLYGAAATVSTGTFWNSPSIQNSISMNAGDFVSFNTNASTATQYAWVTALEY
jgi:hypothetical protein